MCVCERGKEGLELSVISAFAIKERGHEKEVTNPNLIFVT